METRNFINGKFINTISKKNIAVLNPANQKIVGKIDEALDDEIDLAFKSAKNAFDKRILLDMDSKDKSRKESPLIKTEERIFLDTTQIDEKQAFEIALKLIKKKN